MPNENEDAVHPEPPDRELTVPVDAVLPMERSETPASPSSLPEGVGLELANAARRSDVRRFADQNDMLSDDPGEHRLDAHDDPDHPRPSIDWATEVSATRIGGELRRIEAEVRQILDAHDLKRKRKMAGTRRWHELEEDIIAWRFSPRIDDALLVRLRDLVARRHHVFQRLRFIASTRPTWNS